MLKNSQEKAEKLSSSQVFDTEKQQENKMSKPQEIANQYYIETKSFLDNFINQCMDYPYGNSEQRKTYSSKQVESDTQSQPQLQARFKTFSINAWSIIVVVLLFVIGLIFANSVNLVIKNASTTANKNQKYIELAIRKNREIAQSQQDIVKLRSEINQKQMEIFSRFSSNIRNTVIDEDKIDEPITGKGIKITIEDSSNSAQNDRLDKRRVQDKDLLIFINALLKNGAEAISISGHRFEPNSTIRGVGGAILFDLQPLSSPYTILAIGNPNHLQTGLYDDNLSSYILELKSIYGITTTITAENKITISKM